MLIYNIITALCLIIMLFIVAKVMLNLFYNKTRVQKIQNVRKFKKGQCAIIFIPAIPLYFIGKMYSALNDSASILTLGEKIADSIISTISNMMTMIVLRYDIGHVEELAYSNDFYKWTIYLLYILVTVNAMVFALSIFYQKISYSYNNLHFKKSKYETKRIIIGNNKNSIEILKSCEPLSAIIADQMSENDKKDLFDKGIPYLSVEKTKQLIDFIDQINSFDPKNFDNSQKLTVIINYDSEEKKVELCNKITEYLKTKQQKFKAIAKDDDHYENMSLMLYKSLKFFVFGNPAHEDLYQEFEKKSEGFIHYINKYRQIAIDFIDRHPITKYMNDSHIDYKTALLRDNLKINCAYIGFGKTSQHLFLSSVANNQFLCGTVEAPRLYPINYHIFDKSCSESISADNDNNHRSFCNKNLNHSFFRFYHELLDNLFSLENQNKTKEALDIRQKYLELPERPAIETYHHLDINDYDFYDKLSSIFCKSTADLTTLNFIVIAFGTDLENIDMANKLTAKKAEWQIEHLHIFVKIRDDKLAKTYAENLNDNKCHIIGNEKQIVYNIDSIENQRIELMAIERNSKYDSVSNANEILAAEKNRYKDIPAIRLSNIYCCLSLRSKLNMIGLDYTSEDINSKDDLFISKYADEKYLKLLKADQNAPDFNFADYCECFIENPLDTNKSLRTIMAIQEHYRWNSFMISQGFVPATLDEIKNGEKNGKNYALRKHGNITTMKGLIDFRQIVIEKAINKDASLDIATLTKDKDVIKYDYQILDNACEFLQSKGYKIIKK